MSLCLNCRTSPTKICAAHARTGSLWTRDELAAEDLKTLGLAVARVQAAAQRSRPEDLELRQSIKALEETARRLGAIT